MKSGWLSEVKKIGLPRAALLAAAVIVLIVCSVPWETKKNNPASSAGESDSRTADETPDSVFLYEKSLEERLEKILGEMEGIVSVDVMITLSSTAEKVLEKTVILEENKQEEEKGSGDSAEKSVSSSLSKNSQALLTESDGSGSMPYVLKEISPVVQGVLVAAEGTITQTKISEISEAVQALFDIEAHKVKVIEKKSQAEEAK